MCSSSRFAADRPPPLAGHDVVTADVALVEGVTRHGGPDVVDYLVELGTAAGSAEPQDHGRPANRHEPELTPHGRPGRHHGAGDARCLTPRRICR